MDSSFLSKQVAKEIALLRHLPNQQLYEISITWQGDQDTYSSLHYLPEIFLYPYAVRKDRPTQSTKVSQISLCSDTSLQLEEKLFKSSKIHSFKPYAEVHPKAEFLKQDNSKKPASPQQMPLERTTLNYDEVKRKLGVRDLLTKRNREVLKFKQIREGRKKRKI